VARATKAESGAIEFVGAVKDVTEQKRAEVLVAGEKRLLEMIARGNSLSLVLDALCRFGEEVSGNVLVSILLLSPDGKSLRHAILNQGTVNLVNGSTLSGNTGVGGGIYNSGGTVTISNGTLSGNGARFGGGIYNNDTVTVESFSGIPAEVGTAFDGEYLWQIADARIQKVDPRSGEVVATIPAPANGRDSGLTWAEGTLWVGEYRARKIHQIDPNTGAILRTIESDRFVTGVSWVNGELWHGTLEAEQSELRRVDPETGKVLEQLDMPGGVTVSGLESDGAGVFYCGGSSSGKVRAVRKPNRPTANERE